MAVTIQPPVQLDPTMDGAQQASFLNQNFQSIVTSLQATLNNDFLKVVKTGTVTLPLNATIGGNNQVQIAHGQSGTPAVIAYVLSGGFAFVLPFVSVNPYSSGATLQGRVAYQVYWYVDTTNVTFYYEGYTQGTGGSLPIKYYILQETAT